MKYWNELTKQGKARRINLILSNEDLDSSAIWNEKNNYDDYKYEESLDNIRDYIRYNHAHLVHRYDL